MTDYSLFEDRTIQRLIVGIAAGLALGMILDIVLVVFRGSAYMPVVFFFVLVIVMAVLVRWSKGLE
jgi:uncharacterized membrane protein YgaE (UPF0421/DUF939 family)